MLATAIVAGVAGVGLYRAGISEGMKQMPPPGTGAMSASETDKKPLYWHDPMYPGQKFDKPGKSPFMDMQLVPVYAIGAGDEGTVTISPRLQQNLGVRTALVTEGSLSSRLSAVGNVAYNERDVALVQARSAGYVERLHVRAPLDRVKKGQALLELYIPDWIAVQEEYLTARRMQGSGIAGLADAARQRMRLAGMTEPQIRVIESTGKVHPRMTIHAPASGVVAELSAREGMTVVAGAPLYRINGLDTVWVNAEVPEAAAARVRPGAVVEARTPGLPGEVFKGRVGAILPEVDPSTRTLKARIELANPSGQMLPGMFATLTFAPAAGKEVLLVPSEAVIQTGTRSVVIVAREKGEFLPVEVKSGIEANGQTEIREGLAAGQKVVVSGQFLIDSEASLKGAIARMGGTPEPGGGKVAARPHRAEGKIERIADDEITISHGPVASLQWGPMTMGFKPPPGGLPRNVAVGDTVTFDFRQQDGNFAITAISPTAAAPAPPAAPTKPAGAPK
ncbi:efflux RND transporter periplasmic adaptor subunit [Massilia glaciei]|nr:efflux RND transporter periplasmic adaptor subunit [Massilia glaciei]